MLAYLRKGLEMARKGTLGERALACFVGFIAYGAMWFILNDTLTNDANINYLLNGGIMLVSVAFGVVVAFVMALVILKIRK